ncbi:guanine exchange factor for Rac gxcDD [Acrasis kona]|uniref:Guanine exchange factor for Rac gxcDD n=1 Tax=Acrasis kona TaxID=1008807 RepID=A0AAW2YMX9_9EUKA
MEAFLVLLVAVCSFLFLPILFKKDNGVGNEKEYIQDLQLELSLMDATPDFEFTSPATSPINTNVEQVIDDEEIIKMEKKRKYILSEFLETEETYDPIRRQKLINPKTFSLIFKSIEVIKGVNETFLQELQKIFQQNNNITDEPTSPVVKKLASHTSALSQLLLHYAHSFKLYTAYISSYRMSHSTLTVEKADNRELKLFLGRKTRELAAEGSRITNLESFLILPIQRLPRYRLLLEDLARTVPPGQDHVDLTKATQLVRQVTDFCNEKEREYERQERFLKIRSELKQPEIKPSRRYIGEEVERGILCSEGNFKSEKSSSISMSPCNIYLFNDVLVVKRKSSSILKNGVFQIGLRAGTRCPQTQKTIQTTIVSAVDETCSFMIQVKYESKSPRWTKFTWSNREECQELRDNIEAQSK